MFKFSQKSLNNLQGVKPELVKVVKRALELSPVDFGVREGLRTVEQQRENVRKGVSQTMNSKHRPTAKRTSLLSRSKRPFDGSSCRDAG